MMLQSAVLGVGAYLVIKQEATAGIIIASSILTSRALAPVELAIAHWSGFVAARQSWRRLQQLLGAAAGRAGARTPLPAPRKSARRRGRQRRPARRAAGSSCRSVAFALKAGQGLGVIGPSASGKSSLVRGDRRRVACRRGARSALDGAALDQWSPEALGRHIGYLPQDVELFAGTVPQNIARFEPDARSGGGDRRRRGGRRARADPAPARTATRPRSAKAAAALSAGQRQRIGAGARALRRSVPGRARRAQLQPRPRRRRGADARPSSACARAAASSSSSAHRPSALAGVDQLLVMADGPRCRRSDPRTQVLAKLPQPRSRRQRRPLQARQPMAVRAGVTAAARRRRDRPVDPPAICALGLAAVVVLDRRRRRLGGAPREISPAR